MGPLGALVGAAGAGFFGGSLINNELEADAVQLAQVFHAMIAEYDTAMRTMIDTSYLLMGNYHENVRATVSQLPYNATQQALLVGHSSPNGCSNCGATIRAGMRFCTTCGTPVSR